MTARQDAQFSALVGKGVTPDLAAKIVYGFASADEVASASAPVVAPVTPAAAPDWLIARGARKADRRALAAELRAQDPTIDFSSDEGKALWAAAKKRAGIRSREIAAHKAFLASKKAAKA